jgi:hypothetical protein
LGRRLAAASREKQKSREADPRLVGLALRNANSHIDRHGHDCPSVPAMQHSGGADKTVDLHR